MPLYIQKLFETFMRLEDNTTRTTRGTGLGLFIVKGLIEAMNGNIEISSTSGCGFCATVEINLANNLIKLGNVVYIFCPGKNLMIQKNYI